MPSYEVNLDSERRLALDTLKPILAAAGGPFPDMREIAITQRSMVETSNYDGLVGAGLPRFILKGISRVGAFYLPKTWQHESETRLLAKRFAGGGAPVVAGPRGEYWSVPIGQPDPTAELSLIEIGVRNLSPAIVGQRVANWCAKVRVVTD